MFSRSGNSFLIFLLSYHVRVTSKIQVNFRYRRYLKVLMIVSYRFLKFLHYLCFWGQKIHCLHSYWATMFGWPRKSRSTSGTGGTWRYWWFCLIDFRNFFSIYVFRVKKSIADIPSELLCLSDLENLGQLLVQEVHRGTDDYVLWNFKISQLYMFSRTRNPLLTFLLSYLLWVTSKTSGTGSWPRFFRSPEHDSSVRMSAMDSLTSKTWILEKLWKFTRQNHQYLLNRKLTLIFKVTRTW